MLITVPSGEASLLNVTETGGVVVLELPCSASGAATRLGGAKRLCFLWFGTQPPMCGDAGKGKKGLKGFFWPVAVTGRASLLTLLLGGALEIIMLLQNIGK
jgi:hypothetical protein